MDIYDAERIASIAFYIIGIITLATFTLNNYQQLLPYNGVKYVNTNNLTYEWKNNTYPGVEGIYKEGEGFYVSIEGKTLKEVAYIILHETCHHFNYAEKKHYELAHFTP